MTDWNAQIMPDDALTGLVGDMLRREETPNELPIDAKLGDERQPLWVAMDEVGGCPCGKPWALISGAAEIEALRDWLLPEETEPPSSPHMGNFIGHALWNQRQQLRNRLTEEARIAREAA